MARGSRKVSAFWRERSARSRRATKFPISIQGRLIRPRRRGVR